MNFRTTLTGSRSRPRRGACLASRVVTSFALAATALPSLAADVDLHDWWVAEIGGAGAAIPAAFNPSPWTFRSTVTGPFIGPGVAPSVFGNWASVGMVGGVYSAGQLACTGCGVPADTQARFDGVFVHPGTDSGYDPIIRYTFAGTVRVASLDLWAEAVQDSLYGNGMTAVLTHSLGGTLVSDGSVAATYGYRVSGGSANLHVAFAAPLTFQANDYVEVNMSDNGSVLWDHTGVNLRITETAVTSNVPEPGTYALMLAGLGAMAFVRRRSGRGG